MRILSGRVKRHPVLAAVLAWLIIMTPVGMTAEAAFNLDHSYEPTEGLHFIPEIEGLQNHYVTGTLAAPKPITRPVTFRAPTRLPGASSGRCGGSLPSCSIMACESGGSLTARNPSGAAGKWQVMPGTWAGYGGYSSADQAPEDVQDAKARELWAGGAGRGHWRQCL